MSCRRCREAKQAASSEPLGVCAFPVAAFDTVNWNCRTLAMLRQAARDASAVVRSLDQALAVVPVPHQLSELVSEGDVERMVTHVVLYWYKDRGRVEAALAVDCSGAMRSLDLLLAEKLADHLEAAAASVELSRPGDVHG